MERRYKQSFNKATVIIDPSRDDHPSLMRALQWDRLFDLDIELLACAVDELSLLQEYLEHLAKPLNEQGVTVSITALEGNPNYETLVRHIFASQPDIVFHSARYHSWLCRQCLSNQDWMLVRACPVPFLLVRDRKWNKSPLFLAAVDPFHHSDVQSMLDSNILSMTKVLQLEFDGDLRAVHSYSPIKGSGYQFTDIRSQHLAACEDLMTSFQLDRNKLIMKDGVLSKVLPALVQELEADVVVMGAVSRSRPQDAFIGFSAELVMDYLECDVLIVKPIGFQCPILLLPPVSSA